MVWMLQVSGFIIDIRNAPVELQRAAFEKGLIPNVRAERDEGSCRTTPHSIRRADFSPPSVRGWAEGQEMRATCRPRIASIRDQRQRCEGCFQSRAPAISRRWPSLRQ